MNTKLCYIQAGLVDYATGLTYQQQARTLVEQGDWDGIVLFLEHTPVITIGMHGGNSHLLAAPQWLSAHGVEVIHTNRGGDITCHNPGQLVCYPILNLKKWQADVHWYVRQLEECIIQTVKDFHIRAGRKAVYTGVWAGNRKIAALGIGVKHWITYHGTALNITNDLDLFSRIIPCGITEFGVTSMAKEGCKTTVDDVILHMMRHFSALFTPTTHTLYTDWSEFYGRTSTQKTNLA